MTILDKILQDSSKIYIPLLPSTSGIWSPNFFVVENIYGRMQAMLPNMQNPAQLILQPAKIMVYKLVYAEILPPLYGRTEQYNEIELQPTETQHIPAVFDMLLLSYETVLANVAQANAALALFQFRSEKLAGLNLQVDIAKLQEIVNYQPATTNEAI